LYGLPQAGIFANQLLEKRLATKEYYQCQHTPGLEFRLFANAFLIVTPHYLIYCHFFLSVSHHFWCPFPYFFARKFCLPESLFLKKNSNQSLFLDKNSNQIDSLILNLIIFILCDGSSIGWVAVAVADASSIGWVAVVVSMAAAVAVLAVQKIAMPLPFDGWWLQWRSKRGCTGIL
jgi:hypothetical protein